MSQANIDAILALEPPLVWKLFSGLSAQPRPSRHEEKVRAHVLALAVENGLSARVDQVGNVLVEVPATPGHEGAPIVVLQGHLDMVGEANRDKAHNFETDPIILVLDEEEGQRIVRADGTTLGADNGIGVAMAMAAALDPEVIHGPLELLMTIDEEMGMGGAEALTGDFFAGRRLINLDTEEDTAICIGCAGGIDTTLSFPTPMAAVPAGHEGLHVVVSGLRGGHSGGDIHENRGNAIKVLARTLRAEPAADLRIASMQGGSKRNAIPREASAVVTGPAGFAEALAGAADRVVQSVINESGDGGLRVSVVALPCPGQAWSAPDTARVLDSLLAVPSGVVGMHPQIENLVQTSNNLSTVGPAASDPQRLEVGMLTRSSTESLLLAVAQQLAAIGRLAGANVDQYGQYPGWAPNPDSPLLGVCRRVYVELFGTQPEVNAVHAGLECGIIGERVGEELDTVSFGPTIRGAHSPDERVFVDSVGKSWRYLRAVLAELARG